MARNNHSSGQLGRPASASELESTLASSSRTPPHNREAGCLNSWPKFAEGI
jgi:hypothetical protein